MSSEPELRSIFKGAPSSNLRKPLKHFIEAFPPAKVIVPFAGRFAAVATIVNSGIKPVQIYASDISLFSSLIGYYLSGKSIDDLGIELLDPELQFLPFSDAEQSIASILFAFKFYQIVPRNQYLATVRKEMLRHWDKYHKALVKQVQDHKPLKGIHYEISDVFDQIKKWRIEADALFYLNPPIYKSGYTKMFDTKGKIAWKAPLIPEFTQKHFAQLFTELDQGQSTALIMAHDYSSSRNIEQVPDNWYRVFAHKSSNRITHYVANKPLPAVIIRPPDNAEVQLFPLHADEDEITRNSKIRFMQISDASAHYYRDLFIHRLWATDAEQHLGLFVDGKLMTVFGLTLADAMNIGQKRAYNEKAGFIFENYGMTVPSSLSKNRLFMALLISKEFENYANYKFRIGVTELKGIRTACLTRLPENRIIHGLYKLTKREQKAFGWHLIYEAKFNSKTGRQTIAEWLDQQSKIMKGSSNSEATSSSPEST